MLLEPMYTSAAFPDIAFENDRARLFADYWASLPKIDLVPMRSAFEPSDVPNLLQTCEIHELVRPGVVLVRLSG
ncbi:MAG: PAS domain-containing protein, partial [Rickettsiales bacterium]